MTRRTQLGLVAAVGVCCAGQGLVLAGVFGAAGGLLDSPLLVAGGLLAAAVAVAAGLRRRCRQRAKS